MQLTIIPRPLSGGLKAVSSKSLSHRYVIAAGLAQGTSVIDNILLSDDLDATKEALAALGVTFVENQIMGGPLKLNRNIIDCKESGSTLRFMIPILMVQPESVTLIGQNRLPQRPLDIYHELFREKGLLMQKQGEASLPITVQGPLRSGHYQMRGDISSQFITGLLFALPLLAGDSSIELTTSLSSKGYVDLTLETLTRFGIDIHYAHPIFTIKGNQTYRPQKLTVEEDYSQAAFFMVAGTIGAPITLSHLHPKSKQGDRAMVDIIQHMKGSVIFDDKTHMYTITPCRTKGMIIDLDDIPDLGPILMVLAAVSEGTTIFQNVNRLRIKESDRLEAMIQTLNAFGVPTELDDHDRLRITGQPILKGNLTLDSFKDHRIAMAIAIAAIRADGPVTITHAEVVNKSYPTFFEDYAKLGGMIHES